MLATTINSVGIDIGTSTTQVVFSRLQLRNTAGSFSVPHVDICDKTLLYASPVQLTPLLDRSTLDGEALRQLVEAQYQAAGMRPELLDSGAVIVTGESARKDNARLVAKHLSGLAGDFVVALAGPDLEAIIAGKGSGAAQFSAQQACTVVNLDIGGGTTNAVLFEDGEIRQTGCLDVGGRLIIFRPDGCVDYVSASVERIAAEQGVALRVGQRPPAGSVQTIANRMATLLEELVGLRPPSQLLPAVTTNGSGQFRLPRLPDRLCFSGGVADCIRDPGGDPLRYHDIGPALGAAIADSSLCRRLTCLPARETIRATVVGAGSHSTTISGSTIAASRELLPLQNIPVLRLNSAEQERCYDGDSGFLRNKLAWFLEQSGNDLAAIACKGEKSPSYQRLNAFAACVEAAASQLPPAAPVLLVLEADTGMSLGRNLRRRLGPARPVICIDSVKADSGDYLDLGRPLLEGMVVPVVVKTLAFG